MRTKRLAVIHCCKQTNTKTKTEKEKNCCDKIKKIFHPFPYLPCFTAPFVSARDFAVWRTFTLSENKV